MDDRIHSETETETEIDEFSFRCIFYEMLIRQSGFSFELTQLQVMEKV